MTIYYPTTIDFAQKTLGAQLLTATTAAATLNNVTGIQNLPGVMIIDRVNTSNVETPDKVEVISFTATSGVTVTNLVRGLAGTTAQDHAVNAIVEFGPDIVWAQGLIDTLLTEHNTDGTHKSAVVTTLKATGAEVTTGTSDVKIVTPKALSDAGFVLDTDGTLAANSDVKIATQKAVKTYVASNAGNTDGWTASSDTWTYASASTFTIAGVDRTTTFTKGTRLKFTNSGTKYAVVVSSSFSTNTTVTIAVNNDYTIANAAITSPYYSYQQSPQGYPTWFGYDPTWTGYGTPPTTDILYKIDGNSITLNIASVGATSNSASFRFTLPVTPVNQDGQTVVFPVPVADAGTVKAGVVGILHGDTTARIGNDMSTIAGNAFGGFTASGNKTIYGGTILFKF